MWEHCLTGSFFEVIFKQYFPLLKLINEKHWPITESVDGGDGYARSSNKQYVFK